MLPKPLTEDICSLRAGVERLAFSVLWVMTPDARTVSVRFTKSVIRCGTPPSPRSSTSLAALHLRLENEGAFHKWDCPTTL